MYSLHLNCGIEESDFVLAELWEAGTLAIGETETDGRVFFVAGFATNEQREKLLTLFSEYSPEWRHEPTTDWIQQTHAAWPARPVGERLFLTPTWSEEPTPPGRHRIIHNPGLACGTGEHPCTQLALMALEKHLTPGSTVVDVGTGSGLLAIAALRLGAMKVVGVDADESALRAARENFGFNGFEPALAVGSADCLAKGCADITVANISGTVLLAILDDLLSITREEGWLILTGFTSDEVSVFERALPGAETTEFDEWRCVVAKPVWSV